MHNIPRFVAVPNDINIRRNPEWGDRDWPPPVFPGPRKSTFTLNLQISTQLQHLWLAWIIILGPPVETNHVYQLCIPGALYSETPQDQYLELLPYWENQIVLLVLIVLNFKEVSYIPQGISIYRNADMSSTSKAASYVHGQTRQRPWKTERDLEGFWKDDPVGRWIPGPIRAFPLSVFIYGIVFVSYITIFVQRKPSTAERSSLTDALTEAQPKYGVSMDVLGILYFVSL